MDARVLILAAVSLLPVIAPAPARPAPVSPAAVRQAAESTRRLADYQAAGSVYGPVTCAGFGCVDGTVMVDGRAVQLEYLQCVPALRAGTARYFEDGSVSC